MVSASPGGTSESAPTGCYYGRGSYYWGRELVRLRTPRRSDSEPPRTWQTDVGRSVQRVLVLMEVRHPGASARATKLRLNQNICLPPSFNVTSHGFAVWPTTSKTVSANLEPLVCGAGSCRRCGFLCFRSNSCGQAAMQICTQACKLA
jgi:hypothetical protein